MVYIGYVKVVLLATVVMVAHGLICQYPPCELVKCEMVDEEKCNGTVRIGGGYCGCCLACFTTLGIGESCGDKDPINSQYYPPTALCEKGLYCHINSGTCQLIPGHSIG